MMIAMKMPIKMLKTKVTTKITKNNNATTMSIVIVTAAKISAIKPNTLPSVLKLAYGLSTSLTLMDMPKATAPKTKEAINKP